MKPLSENVLYNNFHQQTFWGTFADGDTPVSTLAETDPAATPPNTKTDSETTSFLGVEQDATNQDLKIIHTEIDTCRVCEPLVTNFSKPCSMSRGEPGSIVIVGQEPGKGEITTQKAFSGRSGRRLDKWLIASGFDAQEPRQGIYTTSVAKCLCDKPKLKVLYANCTRFLDRQLRTIQPSLVITLGVVAYKSIRFDKIDFKAAVCTLRQGDKENSAFRTRFGFEYTIMVWPHPSPGSLWHNSADNSKRLQESFTTLRSYLFPPNSIKEQPVV